MTNNDFTAIFLSYIKKGDKILDLGAGLCKYSQMFADKGAANCAACQGCTS